MPYISKKTKILKNFEKNDNNRNFMGFFVDFKSIKL